MRAKTSMQQNVDTTGWSIVGLIMGLFSSPELHNLLVQAVVIILFPSIGWTLLYLVKREVTYRLPPKEPKALKDENLDQP